MPQCRREAYCKYGIAKDEDGEVIHDGKDPKRCFRCLVSDYSEFEPHDD